MNYWIIISIAIGVYVIGQGIFSGYLFDKARNLSKVSYAGQTEYGNSTSELRVLLAGDSIATGVGSTSFETSLPGRLVNELSKTHRVIFTNVAKSGNKMSNLINVSFPEEKQNLMIIFIASNDLLHFTSLNKFEQHTKSVLDKYSKISDKVILIGPADVGGATAVPLLLKPIYAVRWSKYASVMKDISASHPNVQYINPIDYKEKLKEYDGAEAKDGFHPNDNGHKYWADIILSTVT